ncbi:ClpP/crotonase-like domain-containing protein [Geopyxis carbonaria]|nr:ClpP/crotonase-like domain-containing protein [Geopyxis carbonaria]
MPAVPTPPPTAAHEHIHISHPTPYILLVTISRIAQMNSITSSMHHSLAALWAWYDATPSLRCAIITGARGTAPKPAAAFSAGADLKEWLALGGAGMPEGGFMGLSTRRGKKPVLAAVHGVCFGGGMEAAVNCDWVVAHASSRFALPEAQRGVIALAGVLPRLAMAVGIQRASEVAIGGRVLTAREAEGWGLVARVTDGDVVAAAVEMAERVAAMSPDSVIATREGLRSVLDGVSVDEAVKRVETGVFRELQKGENIKEGLRAFSEKRETKWVDSKL